MNKIEEFAEKIYNETGEETYDIFCFLFELRDSGTVNMFGAVPHITAKFPGIDKKTAQDILLFWMENFDEIKEYYEIEE